jgi:hypothetical protein
MTVEQRDLDEVVPAYIEAWKTPVIYAVFAFGQALLLLLFPAAMVAVLL